MDNQTIKSANWFVDQLNLYQSANSDNESIKNSFVIRKVEFEIIINALKNKKEKDPLQHELILGRRGSGKSTLLKRIQIEIEENPEFHKKYIAVNLAEEQAGVYRLFDLWEEVLKEIYCKLNLEIKLKEYSEFKEEQEFTRYLYQNIHEVCNKEKRKVVLLLDNFDRIIENFTDDGSLLREILTNYNDIQFITASTRMDEHFWSYDKPFYEFFRKHRLEALSTDEIYELINHWSESLKIPELKNFISNNKGKIETIRILTDGLPRTLQFFIQILLQHSDLYGYDYLRKVMDNITPLYQERLNNLTPQFRKIIVEMAFIWEACNTKQLVEKCRMESKLISANLKTLTEKGIVEKITTDKKNHLYRISERFFNMWLIITQGNPNQKRKAKWLSIFLENWYDAKDFKMLTIEHIENLKNNKLSFDKALIFSKALSQSKYISTEERDDIINMVEELNPNKEKNSFIELPKKFKDIVGEVNKLIERKEYEKAIELVNDIENEEDGKKYFLMAYIYDIQKKYSEAEEYYLKSSEKGNIYALNNIGVLYQFQERFKEAEEYFLLAINKGEVSALNNLAYLYHIQEKYSDAEKYYLLAIEDDVAISLNDLAIFYYQFNIKKTKSLELIKKYNESYMNLISNQPEIIIEIWNGIFNDLENRIIQNFKENEFNNLELFIGNLLIHQQKNLVLKLFQNEEFGKELKDRYKILYYATLALTHSQEENFKLKIPPEIQSTLENILSDIKEKQTFYGY
ncbi:MAG: hypothetical protein A2033_00975 [Bacteroidetes bacterium GWA2_31_9]|nr:MAG: hypothetical protein A2033_00975 [Bacteroidetes bacterium GWA2_31_9]